MFKYKALFCLFITITLFAACKKDNLTQAEIDAADTEAIAAYIEDNNLTTQVTAEGIHYIIETTGNGEHPAASDNVRVHYEGLLLNGDKFDSSFDRGEPSEFNLSGVIAGWTIGIPLFREGGSGTLIIPSKYAYGSTARPGIPANSVLLFNVELITIL